MKKNLFLIVCILALNSSTLFASAPGNHKKSKKASKNGGSQKKSAESGAGKANIESATAIAADHVAQATADAIEKMNSVDHRVLNGVAVQTTFLGNKEATQCMHLNSKVPPHRIPVYKLTQTPPIGHISRLCNDPTCEFIRRHKHYFPENPK